MAKMRARSGSRRSKDDRSKLFGTAKLVLGCRQIIRRHST
jgi:hypothetical protein